MTTQGDSEEHAKSMLQEAVELYLEDIGKDELETLYQPIEAEPRIRTLTVAAAPRSE